MRAHSDITPRDSLIFLSFLEDPHSTLDMFIFFVLLGSGIVAYKCFDAFVPRDHGSSKFTLYLIVSGWLLATIGVTFGFFYGTGEWSLYPSEGPNNTFMGILVMAIMIGFSILGIFTLRFVRKREKEAQASRHLHD